VAIKARTGVASRFPTKKHYASYAGVVPKADNSGDRVSEHEHVKQGDNVLKYALTCAVRGAVAAKADTAVKRFYLKQIRRGKSKQEAEVNAARKLSYIVWKILTSKQRFVEEDKYLTSRKTKRESYRVRRVISHVAKPEEIPSLIKDLAQKSEALQRYSNMQRPRHRKKTMRSSSSRDSEEEMVKK
jgi:hypothetical protein